MAKPEYKLSTPNTGSYQLAPQAAPVSTYVRPKQLDPNLTDFKTQAATFQNFVESMTEWRVAENKDNQEKAQLRALADNALGELDANLEGEDDDYREFGMYLQGKNYAQEVGSKLVTEITVGSEGQMGIMDRAFAEAKLPKNHNRKVADIFSEMLEERKDYYRDQVPDSSDTFYSGFGEALQPYAAKINKAFYEKIQEETYSDRRENFSQGFLDQAKKDIRLVKDGVEKIVFNQAYLREFAADNGIAAGLSEDAALGEAIRIWSQELREVIDGAESEEDLEIANDMLAVFYTDIKSKDGVKGRARLISIPIFEKEAGRLYVALGNAKDAQKKLIEAKEEAEEVEEIKRQGRALFDDYLNKGKFPGSEILTRDFGKLGSTELRAAKNFAEKAKENTGKIDTNTKIYKDNYIDLEIKSRNGSLTEDDIRVAVNNKELVQSDASRLLGFIESSSKLDPPVRDYVKNRLIDGELDPLPRGYRGAKGLDTFEYNQPEDYRKFKTSLNQLELRVWVKTDEYLKNNKLELNAENQLKIMDDVLKDLEPDIQKHNNFVKKLFSEETPEEKQSKEEKRETLVLIGKSGDGGFSFELTPQHQDIYMGDQGHQALYEDYYAYLKKIKGFKSAQITPQNIFSKSGIKGREHVEMFIAIQTKLGRPADEFRNWMSQRLLIDSRAAFLVDSLETTYRELWKIFGEGQFPRDRKSTSGVLEELSVELGGP